MGLRGRGAKVNRPRIGPSAKPGPKPQTSFRNDVPKPRKRRASWRKPGLTRAERVIRFIESLKITSGVFAGRPFKLRPWQKQIIAAIYATEESRDPGLLSRDARRTVRTALLVLPRKNGK